MTAVKHLTIVYVHSQGGDLDSSLSHLVRGGMGGMLATTQHTNTQELYLITNYSHQEYEHLKS